MTECFKCKGFCCKYVTVDISEPETADDFDEIRWFLLHENVIIYKSEVKEEWCLEFRTPCKYLDQNTYLCKNYDNRPEVCKEYIIEECSKDEELSQKGTEIYLENEEDLMKYLKAYHPSMLSRVFPDTSKK